MNILIFGAKGSIGNHLYVNFKKIYSVIGTTRNTSIDNKIIHVDKDNLLNLLNINNVDAIIWASGENCNDNILNFDVNNFEKILDSNIEFILKTLHFLLINSKINRNAKMVIISSIWEEHTRKNKLSYSISKSALSGMVKNLSYDLSKYNILINNVLPGVIDNDMSRKSLTDIQMKNVAQTMCFNRLITLDDIFNTIKFLIIDNTGITGQSIKVDLGFTNIKNI